MGQNDPDAIKAERNENTMHIQDGILGQSLPEIISLSLGGVVALGGTFAGLRGLDDEKIPRVAVLSSAFFVASLIHIPLGPASAHLVLNGLAGLLLGWACFPALLIGLILQGVLFGFGGITTLGLNTTNMALPGVLCYYLFRGGMGARSRARTFAAGFGAGALAILLAGLMTGGALLAAGREFDVIARGILLAHLPVMIIEGFVTGEAVLFLRKVRPETLQPLSEESPAPPPMWA